MGSERPGSGLPRRRALLALVLAALSAAAQAAPDAATARERYAAAQALRFEEDWYGAIESYLAALAKNPSYGEALAGLAECYYGLGEYDQALSYARKAQALKRGDLALADLEGFILVSLGDLAGAKAAFAATLAKAPNDLDARFGLAVLDLAVGKRAEARSRLEDSLRLSPQNARSILSLALIAQDQGRKEEALALVERALRYHGGEPWTQYVAARVSAWSGDFAGAAFHARAALEMKPSYSDARLLLASIMYRDGSYAEAIALMREAVARNRKDGMAWYTLGVAQAAAGSLAEAEYSLRTSVSLRPDDEVARIALENLVVDSRPAEDPARENYAEYHFKKGAELEERSLYDQALFEYRRGLRIYPYSTRGRLIYAGLLKSRGFPGKYLAALRFLKDNDRAARDVLDAIETYESILGDSVGQAWGLRDEDLPKRPYSVALAYVPSPESCVHVGAEAVLARYLADILASSSRLGLAKVDPKAPSFAEAFRRARAAEADYFAVVSFKETDRDIAIGLDLRVARTGSKAVGLEAYRSGNDRTKSTATRVADLLVSSLAPRGALLRRGADTAFVDLGAADGVAAGDKLLVIKSGALGVKPEGLGHDYQGAQVLGEIEVARVGEESCEGGIKSAGFFDAINVGDAVIPAPKPDQAAAKPAAPAKEAPGKAAQQKPAQAAPAAEWPGLFSLVRRLR